MFPNRPLNGVLGRLRSSARVCYNWPMAKRITTELIGSLDSQKIDVRLPVNNDLILGVRKGADTWGVIVYVESELMTHRTVVKTTEGGDLPHTALHYVGSYSYEDYVYEEYNDPDSPGGVMKVKEPMGDTTVHVFVEEIEDDG